jgi:hypothetical protein
MSSRTRIDRAPARQGTNSVFGSRLRRCCFVVLGGATVVGAAAAFAQTPTAANAPGFLLSDRQLQQAMQMPGQKPVAASATQRNQAAAARGSPQAEFTIEPLALPAEPGGSATQAMRVTVTGVSARPGAAAYALFANGKPVAYGIESADLKSVRFIVKAELLPAGVALAMGKAPGMPMTALTSSLEMQQR